MTDFSQITNIPSLPAVLRETPNVTPQVSQEMAHLSAVREAAVANLIRTEQGESTVVGGTAEISGLGGAVKHHVLSAARDIINSLVGGSHQQGLGTSRPSGWSR